MWNATQYLQFQNERTQPSIDLARRIPVESPKTVLDLGCGPGNSTAVLQARFPDAEIVGLDLSEAMLEKARERCPDVTFVQGDALTDLPKLGRTFDVIFSNAVLHWIPDQPRLLDAMMAQLNPGGYLAVQLPRQAEAPIHWIISRMTYAERWHDRLAGFNPFHGLSPQEYHNLLAARAAHFELWQTTYFHRMPSHEAIMAWYRTTGLRPYLEALPPLEAEAFEAAVFNEVCDAYPLQENGEVLFQFPRLFFLAQK